MTLRAVFYAALSATVLLTGCSHHQSSRCPTGCPTPVNYQPCCPQPNPCCNGTTGAFSAPAAVQPVPVAPVPVQASPAPAACCPTR